VTPSYPSIRMARDVTGSAVVCRVRGWVSALRPLVVIVISSFLCCYPLSSRPSLPSLPLSPAPPSISSFVSMSEIDDPARSARESSSLLSELSCPRGVLSSRLFPQGEKYLVLKKKYRQLSLDLSSSPHAGSPLATPDLAMAVSPLREPPPYRPPPPAPLSPVSNTSETSSEEVASLSSARDEEHKVEDDNSESGASASSPPVPPRRKSQDKLRLESKDNVEKLRSSMLEVAIKVRFPLPESLPGSRVE